MFEKAKMNMSYLQICGRNLSGAELVRHEKSLKHKRNKHCAGNFVLSNANERRFSYFRKLSAGLTNTAREFTKKPSNKIQWNWKKFLCIWHVRKNLSTTTIENLK